MEIELDFSKVELAADHKSDSEATQNSVVKYEKKPWILKGSTKKGEQYTRYRVCHKVTGASSYVEGFSRMKVAKPFKPTGVGKSVFITDFGKRLKVSSFHFYKNYALNAPYFAGNNTDSFSLSAKNGKIIVYKVTDGKVKNKSKYFFGKIADVFAKKAEDNRLKTVLRSFFKNNNIFFNEKKSGVENLKNSIYPMNEFLNLSYVDSSISREVGILKIDDFCKKMTGCKGKKTKEMLKGASVGRLQFLKLFKGLIPIDVINGDLKNVEVNGSFPIGIKIEKVRKFLKNFSKERLQIMACSYNSITRLRYGMRISTFTDIVRMWSDYHGQLTLPDQPRDFDELHDALSAQIGRKSKSNIPLSINPALSKLNNLTFENGENKYSIRIPEDSFELAGAGTALNNCLGGYASSVNRGDVSILLISKNDVLSHAMSLNKSGDRFNIQQFVANRNQPPESEEKEAILGILKKNEVIY